MDYWFYLFLVLLGLLVWRTMRSIVVVPSRHGAIVERFGQYKRTLKPGLHLLTPLEDLKFVRWNYREEVFDGNRSRVVNKTVTSAYFRMENVQLDLPPLSVVSKDKLTLDINVTLTYKINNLVNALYEVDDLMSYLQQVVFQAIRYVSSTKTADELYGKDYTLAAEIMHHVAQTLASCGAECTQLMVQSIALDPQIEQANTQLFAEIRKCELESQKQKTEHEKDLKALEMARIRQEQELLVEQLKSKQILERARTEAACQQIKWQSMVETGLTPDHIAYLEASEKFLSVVPSSSVIYLPSQKCYPFVQGPLGVNSDSGVFLGSLPGQSQ